MKATPGPWRVEKILDEIPYDWRVVGPDGERIATVDDWIDGMAARPEGLANARLIAGAREMYAYIKEMAGGDCHAYDKHLNPKPCGTCDSCRARSLLGKIEGQ